MGSKPSSVKGTVVAANVPGTDAATCHVPKQVLMASAPATPQRPDGAPRPSSPGDPFPPCSSPIANGQEAPDCDSSDAASPPLPLPAEPPIRSPRQCATHPGTSSWAKPAPDEAQPIEPTTVLNPPGASDCAGACLRFDAPLEEVLEQATQTFGSMASALSSPKWDRRVEALKGVGTVLKGLDMKASASSRQPRRDFSRGLRCFRAACLILNMALKDKVLPVLFAAHELYRVTFEHGHAFTSPEEAAFAMGVLLQHIMAKLGETNIRLHQSACDAFVFSAGDRPRLSLQDGLSRLQTHLDDCPLKGQQRMRVHAGVLDAVNQLLRRFPGRRAGECDESDAAATWTVGDVVPFVSVGAQVDALTGTRVRQAAASLAVVVFITLGKRSLDEMMVQLPQPTQELVRMKIEQETGELLEEDDGDDPGDEAGIGGESPCDVMEPLDLCVTGRAIPLPTQSPTQPFGELFNMDGQEENFMDEILEDTGMVFQGQGLSIHPIAKDSLTINHQLDEDLRNLGLLDTPIALS